jgi:predicted RNA binding protein YcfA (HicA-like mRNA interferase family)
MTARQLLKTITSAARTRGLTVEVETGKGSHRKVTVGGRCVTSVPFHRGDDLGKGLLGAIQRDLQPCLGERWLR